jgi:hypothetical protein
MCNAKPPRRIRHLHCTRNAAASSLAASSSALCLAWRFMCNAKPPRRIRHFT